MPPFHLNPFYRFHHSHHYRLYDCHLFSKFSIWLVHIISIYPRPFPSGWGGHCMLTTRCHFLSFLFGQLVWTRCFIILAFLPYTLYLFLLFFAVATWKPVLVRCRRDESPFILLLPHLFSFFMCGSLFLLFLLYTATTYGCSFCFPHIPFSIFHNFLFLFFISFFICGKGKKRAYLLCLALLFMLGRRLLIFGGGRRGRRLIFGMK